MQVLDFLKHWAAKESPDSALSRLTEQFGIKVAQYDDRVVLNYCQINSPKMEKIVHECRGLILSYPDFEVMSRTFNRFFNYGETFETQNFPFKESVVYEKIDGSLMALYHDDEKWNVATRGMAYAEGRTISGSSFKELFEIALGESIETNVFAMRMRGWEDHTFICEMCSPETRVVKHYGEKPVVYLLSVRNKLSGLEYMPESVFQIFENTHMQLPQIYDLGQLEGIQASLKELPTMDEGYVILHPTSGNRVKIKNPAYVAIHHLRDNGVPSPRRMVELIQLNETDEYLSYFPEDRQFFEPYMEAYDILNREIKNLYSQIKNIVSQKDFALKVKHLPYCGVLFNMRKMDIDDPRDLLAEYNVKALTELLEKMKEK